LQTVFIAQGKKIFYSMSNECAETTDCGSETEAEPSNHKLISLTWLTESFRPLNVTHAPLSTLTSCYHIPFYHIPNHTNTHTEISAEHTQIPNCLGQVKSLPRLYNINRPTLESVAQ